MDKSDAIEALHALAQETRLEVFRLLVKQGAGGMAAGDIADALGVRQNTMSTNLGIFLAAGLVTRSREGRAVRYFADMTGFSAVLKFLISDCCGGRPELCSEVLSEIDVPSLES